MSTTQNLYLQIDWNIAALTAGNQIEKSREIYFANTARHLAAAGAVYSVARKPLKKQIFQFIALKPVLIVTRISVVIIPLSRNRYVQDLSRPSSILNRKEIEVYFFDKFAVFTPTL